MSVGKILERVERTLEKFNGSKEKSLDYLEGLKDGYDFSYGIMNYSRIQYFKYRNEIEIIEGAIEMIQKVLI